MTGLAAKPGESAFDPSFYASLFAIEEKHFWFRARNRVIATVVSRVTSRLAPGYRVLEVGCGTGSVLHVLESTCTRGSVLAMDLLPEGLRYAHRRTRCPLVQGDIHRAPFRVSFDVIGAFDVIEHLSDDARPLADMRSLLKPGGALVVTVPAAPSLWSYFDDAAGHFRRYTRSSLVCALEGAGLEVEYATPFMTAIFPLVWLGRRLAALSSRERARAHDLTEAELRITPLVNEVLARVLSQEARLIERGRVLPVGTSLLAIARRP